MTDERGVILFDCEWECTPPLAENPAFAELVEWRNRLAERKLIGVDSAGIGYGNISVRVRPQDDSFIISGSQTGHVAEADFTNFCLVTDFDVIKNRVACAGPVRASSESLTHGMVYCANSSVGAVIHVHHAGLWEAWPGGLPQTPAGVEAGTAEMAKAIREVMAIEPAAASSVIKMRGHQGGIIAFGPDLGVAGELVLDLDEAYRKRLR